MTAVAGSAGAPPAPAEREFPFTQRDFRQIVLMLHADAGIVLSEVKAPLVYSRLVKRVRLLGLESFRQYCDLVARRGGSKEREQMMAALTTNVTRFQREEHHFEHLKAKVLPPLLEKARRGQSVRIWSAGCSTGEEPYSIALAILSLMPDAARFDIKILATDINRMVIEKGRLGAYSAASLAPLSREARSQWFDYSRLPDGAKQWRAGADLRSLVTFRCLNLMDPWPMRRRYQAIFCRNVVIYFDDAARERIWSRMAEQLAPGGYLYVGHSERIAGAENRFRLDGATTYRLTEAAPIDPAGSALDGRALEEGADAERQ